MTDRSEALRTIEMYFEAFRRAIERCRTAEAFIAAEWQDAYNQVARLRDRYKEEKRNLTESECKALSKPFEHDTFIDGIIYTRQVGEHVTKSGELTITTPNRAPINMDPETSAMAMFAARVVWTFDTGGNQHRLDHLRQLEEAEKRIAKAIAKAKSL